MKSFKQFCEETAIVREQNAVDKESTFTDNNIDAFVTSLKKQAARFDNLTLSYIQTALSSPGELVSKINEKYPDGDIPNGLLNAISKGIYDTAYADASESECKIINVLAVYYTISNN